LFVATAAAFVAFIPVAPGWVVADVDLGLLGVFAVNWILPNNYNPFCMVCKQ